MEEYECLDCYCQVCECVCQCAPVDCHCTCNCDLLCDCGEAEFEEIENMEDESCEDSE